MGDGLLPWSEVAGICGLCALGASLAVVHGAPVDRSATLALMLAAWQVTGLWWVKGLMAAVLPRRVPWRRVLGVAGARALAEEGQSPDEIVNYFYRDITLAKAW